AGGAPPLSAARSSTNEFHEAQSGQRPSHFGDCAPHCSQVKTVALRFGIRAHATMVVHTKTRRCEDTKKNQKYDVVFAAALRFAIRAHATTVVHTKIRRCEDTKKNEGTTWFSSCFRTFVSSWFDAV